MNIYDVRIGDWVHRVIACSFSVAVSRALRSASKKEKIDGVKNKYCHVSAEIIKRNVNKNEPIPDFEKEC